MYRLINLIIFLLIQIAYGLNSCETINEPQNISFPLDYGQHYNYSIEYVWYLGNFKNIDGKRLGVQINLNRLTNTCDYFDNIVAGNLIITDETIGTIYFNKITTILDPNIALNQEINKLYDWFIVNTDANKYKIIASDLNVSVSLYAEQIKPTTLSDYNGYLPQRGMRIQQTRLNANGNIVIGNTNNYVNGLIFVDHAWFTITPKNNLLNSKFYWNWLFAQITTENYPYEFSIMVNYDTDGNFLPFESYLNIVHPNNTNELVQYGRFNILDGEQWTSQKSRNIYNLLHMIYVPQYGIELKIRPIVNDNEIYYGDKLLYYEGLSDVSGKIDGRQVDGYGTTEFFVR